MGIFFPSLSLSLSSLCCSHRSLYVPCIPFGIEFQFVFVVCVAFFSHFIVEVRSFNVLVRQQHFQHCKRRYTHIVYETFDNFLSLFSVYFAANHKYIMKIDSVPRSIIYFIFQYSTIFPFFCNTYTQQTTFRLRNPTNLPVTKTDLKSWWQYQMHTKFSSVHGNRASRSFFNSEVHTGLRIWKIQSCLPQQAWCKLFQVTFFRRLRFPTDKRFDFL